MEIVPIVFRTADVVIVVDVVVVVSRSRGKTESTFGRPDSRGGGGENVERRVMRRGRKVTRGDRETAEGVTRGAGASG